MTTPFGPRLIGETEKTLSALLRQFLHGTGLTEHQWVTLRLADRIDGDVDSDGLTAAVVAVAHLPRAAELVGELTDRGLLEGGRLSPAGRDLTTSVQATIDTVTAPIWNDLPDDDVAATTRVLNEVVSRARMALR